MSSERAMNREYLGIGWKFPLQVTPQGGIAQAGFEQLVEEAIYLILGTAKGERVMLPDFGCGIHDLVFEPNNSMTRSLVVNRIRESLVRYEPRIDVLQVHVENHSENPETLMIQVDYRIRANNAFHNLVYPFYISEGLQ